MGSLFIANTGALVDSRKWVRPNDALEVITHRKSPAPKNPAPSVRPFASAGNAPFQTTSRAR